MRILVLNQYFHPDLASTGQLLTELCEDLAENHEVTVVAGRPSYDPTDPTDARARAGEEWQGNVRVVRTRSTAFPRAGMAGRLTNYGTYLAACLAGAMRAASPDIVLAMTDPPVVGAAALAVSRIRDVPFVQVNQDLFPQVGVALGQFRTPALVRGLGALNRAVHAGAAAVVAIGRDMERRLLEGGVPPDKLHVIPNWADGARIRPLEHPSALRRSRGWGDRFVVMHSGNVGLSQGLGTLLDAAALLAGHEDIVLAVVGEGAGKARLEKDAVCRRLSNVAFLPYQPRAALSDSLGAADVHLVSLRRGLGGFMVPSKVYGIMAAARPFVAAVEPGTEPALILEEHRCGVRVDPADPGALAAAILAMREQPLREMGRRARRAFEVRYERRSATNRYRLLLERVGSRHGEDPAPRRYEAVGPAFGTKTEPVEGASTAGLGART